MRNLNNITYDVIIVTAANGGSNLHSIVNNWNNSHLGCDVFVLFDGVHSNAPMVTLPLSANVPSIRNDFSKLDQKLSRL